MPGHMVEIKRQDRSNPNKQDIVTPVTFEPLIASPAGDMVDIPVAFDVIVQIRIEASSDDGVECPVMDLHHVYGHC